MANKGLQVHAWVIMSNHVHLIINTTDKTLSEILRDLKRHTSKALLAAIEENLDGIVAGFQLAY